VADRVVIGVGNPERGDDSAGLTVAARLAGRLPPDVRLVRCRGTDPASLIDAWRGASLAVLVDAMVSAAEPGTVARFDAGAGAIPAGSRLVSTHALGAQAAIELARALGALPERLTVIGVEGASFEPGARMSPPVGRGVLDAVRAVLDEVAPEVV
jgi:hydrogenase maturation protease